MRIAKIATALAIATLLAACAGRDQPPFDYGAEAFRYVERGRQ